MKIAYFDCPSGISGDMILAALINAGLDIEKLIGELGKLQLSGYEIRAEKAQRKGIWGTRFEVIIVGGQAERSLRDVLDIIEKSDFDKGIKTKSREIFSNLAQAEAKIHNKNINEIHFHEVGATDAIIDIVGCLVGLKMLGVERIHTSRLQLGSGFVKCAHGTLPVPAPATLELLKDVPVYSTGLTNELVTPTGAAIITALSAGYGEIPSMRIEKIGYGIGSRDLPIPNVLRVLIGEGEDSGYEEDTVVLLETNIDDMNPQFYDHIMDRLFQKGAKDVFLTPIYMKKNRPAIVLSVLCSPHQVEDLLDVVFKETTTLGVRISETKKRRMLKRKTKVINTRFGKVRVKLSVIDGKVRSVVPEYEDCKKLAIQHGLPLQKVYEEIKWMKF